MKNTYDVKSIMDVICEEKNFRENEEFVFVGSNGMRRAHDNEVIHISNEETDFDTFFPNQKNYKRELKKDKINPESN